MGTCKGPAAGNLSREALRPATDPPEANSIEVRSLKWTLSTERGIRVPTLPHTEAVPCRTCL
jgi:hypothetical protein